MLTAIIVAAGSSTRFGPDKLFVDLGGKPVVQRAVEAFQRCAGVEEILVVARAANRERIVQLFGETPKVKGVIPGGERRQDSVRAGLAEVESEFVAVHDAARALILPQEIERVFAAARRFGAAALAAEVTETLKRADREGLVVESVRREDLFVMQTPQIFRTQSLRRAYGKVGHETMTDEVSAMQLIGEPVRLVRAEEPNFKITFPADLALARLVVTQRVA